MERAYDTLDGIKTYLTSLEGLNRLIRDRHEAGYKRKERLQDFLILGRWMTDSCGNFGDCTIFDDRYKPMDIADGMSHVVAREDVFKLYRVHSLSMSGMRCCVPPVRVKCRECGQRWSISNAHDAIIESATYEVDASLYVGRTYRDLDNELRSKDDGSYFASFELPVKHDRFIDMTPHPTIEDFYTNRDGWVNLADLVRMPDFDRCVSAIPRLNQPGSDQKDWDPWTYVFQDGDRTYGNVLYYTHRHCLDLRKSRDSRDYYVGIFKEAGYPEPVTRQVPNERCQGNCCMPWIIGQFPFGDIKIGWRSSVINIDWSAFPGRPDYESLFDDQQTTKGPTHVHAHGREQAVDFLKRLKLALDALMPCDVESGCPWPAVQFFHEGAKLSGRCSAHRVRNPDQPVSFMDAVVQKVHET